MRAKIEKMLEISFAYAKAASTSSHRLIPAAECREPNEKSIYRTGRWVLVPRPASGNCRPAPQAPSFARRDSRGPVSGQPHSLLAAAWAATITPAWRASGSATQVMFQVPGPTTPGACSAARYLSVSVCVSPGWPCIHTVAA
jgi:hypothetical protein